MIAQQIYARKAYKKSTQMSQDSASTGVSVGLVGLTIGAQAYIGVLRSATSDSCA